MNCHFGNQKGQGESEHWEKSSRATARHQVSVAVRSEAKQSCYCREVDLQSVQEQTPMNILVWYSGISKAGKLQITGNGPTGSQSQREPYLERFRKGTHKTGVKQQEFLRNLVSVGYTKI